MNDDVAKLADRFLQACKQRKFVVATAESCTGGQVIALLTDFPGSSAMVDRGFVTYSNESKQEMIGVTAASLDAFGAVSREVAIEMANGALARSRASIALSVSGIAGPDGGSAAKPVGLVWFGVAMKGRETAAEKRQFDDNGRDFVRRCSVVTALTLGLAAIESA